MSEWMSIDSVPKLEPVQFLRNGAVFTGWFNPDCAEPEFPYHYIDPTVLDGWNGFSVDYPPTHWRKLNVDPHNPEKEE